jgi:hypothetical protein
MKQSARAKRRQLARHKARGYHQYCDSDEQCHAKPALHLVLSFRQIAADASARATLTKASVKRPMTSASMASGPWSAGL